MQTNVIERLRSLMGKLDNNKSLEENDIEELKTILNDIKEYQIDLNSISEKITVYYHSNHYEYLDRSKVITPLFMAISTGSADITELMLEAGANPNISIKGSCYGGETSTEDSTTLVYEAVERKLYDTVKLLITYKADVNVGYNAKNFSRYSGEISSIDSYSPLHRAISIGDEKITQLLIENGAKITRDNLFDAIKMGNEAIVKLLAEKDPWLLKSFKSIFGEDKYNITCLHIAAGGKKENVAILDFLLQKGAMVDALDNKKNTPLYIAIEKGHYEIAKKLILSGANINHRKPDFTIDSLLAQAIDSSDEKMIQLLFDNKIKIYACDIEKYYSLAISKGGSSILKLLLSKIGIKYISNKIIFKAIEENNVQALKVFLAYGVDLNVSYLYGLYMYTPFSYALSGKYYGLYGLRSDHCNEVFCYFMFIKAANAALSNQYNAIKNSSAFNDMISQVISKKIHYPGIWSWLKSEQEGDTYERQLFEVLLNELGNQATSVLTSISEGSGSTLLQIAAERQNASIFQVLLNKLGKQALAELTRADGQGQTALHKVAQNLNPDASAIARMILNILGDNASAIISKADSRGRDVIQLAKAKENLTVLTTLFYQATFLGNQKNLLELVQKLNLTTIDLSRLSLSEQPIKILRGAESITILNLSQCLLDDKIVELNLLPVLKDSLKCLVTLDLSNNLLNFDALEMLLKLFGQGSLAKLETLSVANNHIEILPMDYSRFETLTQLLGESDSIKRLNLTGNFIYSEEKYSLLIDILQLLLVKSKRTVKEFLQLKFNTLNDSNYILKLSAEKTNETVDIQLTNVQLGNYRELMLCCEKFHAKLEDDKDVFNYLVRISKSKHPINNNLLNANLSKVESKEEQKVLASTLLDYHPKSPLHSRLKFDPVLYSEYTQEIPSAFFNHQILTLQQGWVYLIAKKGENLASRIIDHIIDIGEHMYLAYEYLSENGQRMLHIADLITEDSVIKIRFKNENRFKLMKQYCEDPYYLIGGLPCPRSKLIKMHKKIEEEKNTGIPNHYQKSIAVKSPKDQAQNEEMKLKNCVKWATDHIQETLEISLNFNSFFYSPVAIVKELNKNVQPNKVIIDKPIIEKNEPENYPISFDKPEVDNCLIM